MLTVLLLTISLLMMVTISLQTKLNPAQLCVYVFFKVLDR